MGRNRERGRGGNVTWYVLINTMPGSSETVGVAISSHRTLRAAYRAADKAQPNRRTSGGAYVPWAVRLSESRVDRGRYVPQSAPRPDHEVEVKAWENHVYERWNRRR